jgi:hypothetical protein
VQVFRNVLLCAPFLPWGKAATAAERANLESAIALRQMQEDCARGMIGEQGIGLVLMVEVESKARAR